MSTSLQPYKVAPPERSIFAVSIGKTKLKVLNSHNF